MHLTRSSLEQDEHKKQLEHLLSEQLCAKHLAERHLLQVQLVFYKFLAENFGQQISEKQLQQNLPTDQQQLQDSKLAQTNFQQLSLEQHIYKEKILNNELATTFENKKSLEEELSFQSFFFDNLGFQTNFSASGELVEKNFYKEQLVQSSFPQTGTEACKEQLPAAGFTAASDNKQLSNSSLFQQSVAKAASHPDLSPAYPQRATGQKELLHRELQEEQLAARTSTRTPLQRTACRPDLLQHQLLQQQLSRRNLPQTSFSASILPEESFRTTTSQTGSFENNTFRQAASETAA